MVTSSTFVTVAVPNLLDLLSSSSRPLNRVGLNSVEMICENNSDDWARRESASMDADSRWISRFGESVGVAMCRISGLGGVSTGSVLASVVFATLLSSVRIS